MVWDNDRALRNLDAWLTKGPDDNTEDWERYQELHDTDENKAKLAEVLIDLMLSIPRAANTDNTRRQNALEQIIKTGIDCTDIDGRDLLYAYYDIAPSFDKFSEDRRADDPYDREPTEEELHPDLRDD